MTDSSTKGFAALTLLATDTDGVIEKAKNMESTSRNRNNFNIAGKSSKRIIPKLKTITFSDLSFYAFWVCVVAAIIIIAFQPNPKSSHTTTVSGKKLDPSTASPRKPPATRTQSPTAVRPAAKRELSFSEPPAGEGHLLSRAQICWCLREDIRLDAMQPHINIYSKSEVKRFNAMIDYRNSRCGTFRYYQAAMSYAKQEVEEFRDEIIAEAASEVKSWRSSFKVDLSELYDSMFKSTPEFIPTPRPLSAKDDLSQDPATPPISTPKIPAVTEPKSASTPEAPSEILKPTKKQIKEVQQLLNSLGYDSGPIDGKLGPQTKSAIKSFKKDQGEEGNDTIDHNLLKRLGIENTKQIKEFW